MSAIPTDEPAQEAPPSLDAQQIQQQLQQQDAQLNSQSVSAEPNRKRASSFIALEVPDFLSIQQRHPRFGGLVLLVTLAKQDVVKYCHVRLVLLSCSLMSHPVHYPFRAVSKGASELLVPIQILMHKNITDIRRPVYSIVLSIAMSSHRLVSSHSLHQRSICTSTNVCNSTSA